MHPAPVSICQLRSWQLVWHCGLEGARAVVLAGELEGIAYGALSQCSLQYIGLAGMVALLFGRRVGSSASLGGASGNTSLGCPGAAGAVLLDAS